MTNSLALSFFPIADISRVHFKVYATVYSGQQLEGTPFAQCTVQKLPPEYAQHIVSFEQIDSLVEFQCEADTNSLLTRKYLLRLLTERCKNVLREDSFRLDSGFQRRVRLVLQSHPEGDEVFWLEPFFLRSQRRYGFLGDFRFEMNEGAKFNRRVQQLSLSLDKNYKENRNFYADRYRRVQEAIKTFFPLLFPLHNEDGLEIQVRQELARLDGDTLASKEYVFAGNSSAKSQFFGIRNNGPLQPPTTEAQLHFIFEETNRPYSHDLFRALRGETYHTFPGMEQMFGFSLGSDHVKGTAVPSLLPKDVFPTIAKIRNDSRNRTVVPVVLVPWGRHDDDVESDENYYRLKHLFLSNRLPSQFVSMQTLKNRNSLKWSVSNIGLALFAKMGGAPWCVRPRTTKCLVVGIGQSHKLTPERTIERYFAYSILTDTSGLYHDLRVLGRSDDEQSYKKELFESLARVFSDYATDFETFAIHIPFRPRLAELEAIKEAIETDNTNEKNFVVMKFNTRNKYFAYAPQSNSLIPYESTVARLSNTSYLVWFEGLQKHNPKVQRRISRPIHVEFIYPGHDVFDVGQVSVYLQDALNISGTNWRGFNAKSLPVSVYYAQIIAKYFAEFRSLGLDELELDNFTPWFL